MPTINFAMETQDQSNWCWAAVASSVERYYAPQSKWCQCRFASAMAKKTKLRVADCGTCKKAKRLPKTCNQPWYLHRALKLVGRLAGKPKHKPISFSQIRKQIKKRRPVCLMIRWGAGPDAHFVVISGCQETSSGKQYVDIEDPFAGSSTWLYDEFRSNYQYAKGSWVATYPVRKKKR